MLRANYAMLILLPALFVGYAACTGEDASEENNGAAGVAEAQLTTAPMILGTFRDEQRSPSGIATLTLKRDYTFHLEEAVECIRAPCIFPHMEGTYKLTTLDGANVMVLTEYGRDTTIRPEYLRYVLRGDTLWVAPYARYAVWQPLKRSDRAWCDVAYDCTLQGLQHDTCAGQWYCPTDVCVYACGPTDCRIDNSCPAE